MAFREYLGAPDTHLLDHLKESGLFDPCREICLLCGAGGWRSGLAGDRVTATGLNRLSG